MECQTALTWITYAKCRAIHMVSGARYVFFQFEFMGICVVKIWTVTTAGVRKNNATHSEGARAGDPRALLPIMHAAFSFSYTAAGDTKKSAVSLSVSASPLDGASITVQAAAAGCAEQLTQNDQTVNCSAAEDFITFTSIIIPLSFIKQMSLHRIVRGFLLLKTCITDEEWLETPTGLVAELANG